MFAFVVERDENGNYYVPQSGIKKLRNKTLRGWLRETVYVRSKIAGNVYVTREYTQMMQKMSNYELASFIMLHNLYKLN